jgi:nucleoporin POM152
MNAHHESYNGSHILAPICEGVDAHADLDLTGKCQFRCLYLLPNEMFRAATVPNYV